MFEQNLVMSVIYVVELISVELKNFYQSWFNRDGPLPSTIANLMS